MLAAVDVACTVRASNTNNTRTTTAVPSFSRVDVHTIASASASACACACASASACLSKACYCTHVRMCVCTRVCVCACDIFLVYSHRADVGLGGLVLGMMCIVVAPPFHPPSGWAGYYQEDHEDQCFNNTFILAHPRPHETSKAPSTFAWADLRGCDSTQQKYDTIPPALR